MILEISEVKEVLNGIDLTDEQIVSLTLNLEAIASNVIATLFEESLDNE
jgi:hypothetical protein